MVHASDVQFVRAGDVEVAYRVVGDGPVDLVSVEGAFSHLDVKWDLPAYRRFYERLGEIARVILFDKRGMGMSDRVPGATTLETRMEDVGVVMDTVGSERAFVMGESEGGPLSMLFAAAQPQRCAGLILLGAEVCERTSDDWPWGEATEEDFERLMVDIPELWGSGKSIAMLAPSVADQDWAREWIGRMLKSAATPRAAEAFMRMAFDIDIRSIVPSVRVPTLILHTVGDQVCHVENARYLAKHIPGSRYVELEGADHIPWFQPEPFVAEIVPFLSGGSGLPLPDRVLTTVLFTDIVGSTRSAAELGDQRWRAVLEDHYEIVRANLRRYRGVEVSTGGDSFLATFDGPARAVQCAQSIVREIRQLGLELRAGVHTGEVEKIGDDVAGIGVHIGARMAGLADAGEVLVSATVRDLVAGSGLAFEDRGIHELRDVPGQWTVLAALDQSGR